MGHSHILVKYVCMTGKVRKVCNTQYLHLRTRVARPTFAWPVKSIVLCFDTVTYLGTLLASNFQTRERTQSINSSLDHNGIKIILEIAF